jgi:hypothetical protein
MYVPERPPQQRSTPSEFTIVVPVILAGLVVACVLIAGWFIFWTLPYWM